jgi:hypothetical protein
MKPFTYRDLCNIFQMSTQKLAKESGNIRKIVLVQNLMIELYQKVMELDDYIEDDFTDNAMEDDVLRMEFTLQ